MGTWRAKTASSGALGPFCGLETTKSGCWHREKVSWESRFGPSSPRYGQFSGFGPRDAIPAQMGPTWAKEYHLWAKIGQRHDEKAAHTLPEWIVSMNVSMNGDSGPRRCLSRTCRFRVLVILGRFGPALGPGPRPVPFERAQAHRGREAGVSGRRLTPKMAV